MSSPSPAIANEFIGLAAAEGRQLTQMQLQKLTYIAHGWNLAINRTPLVSDELQAWDHGPVFPQLYDCARYFGSSPIPRPLEDKDSNKFRFFFGDGERGVVLKANLTTSEEDVIARVWRRYGPYSAFKLSDLTHKPGTPWYSAYFERGKNATITDDVIKRHYLELARSAAV